MSSPREDDAPAASPEDGTTDESTHGGATADQRAARRRDLLADLDLLPETTSDESGAHAGRSDDDYRADRPPHHGD